MPKLRSFLVVLMKRIAAFCHGQQLIVPAIFFAIFGIWQFVINEWSWEAFWRNPWTSSFPYISTALLFLAVQIVLAARDLNRQIAAEKEADKPRIIGAEQEKPSKAPGRVIGSLFVLFVLALETLALRAAYPAIRLPVPPPAPGLPTLEPVPRSVSVPGGAAQKQLDEAAPYCYLSIKTGAIVMEHYPTQLVVINPSKEAVMATTAIMRNGTGPLFQRTLHPNPNDESIDRPLQEPIPLALGTVVPGTADLLFGIAPGTYTFEIGTLDHKSITENIQIVHRNGEWLQVLEVYRDSKLVYSTPKPPDQPDISLSVNNIKDPILSLENISRLLLKDPYYKVVLWRLSNRTAEPLEWSGALQGSWIRAKERLGPIHLRAQPPFTTDEELFGYAIVTCPECADTKAFNIAIRIGVKGWYSQLETGMFPWSTETFIRSMPWAVNDIPTRSNEDRKQIYEMPLY